MPPPSVRSLVKSEYQHEHGEYESSQIITKEVPHSATELVKLKKDFSHSPRESEVEYICRVSLFGGSDIIK